MSYNDTIVALITPFGKSAIGVIRISGKNSSIVAKKILKIVPKPKIASYLSFFDLSNSIIDKGIAIWFPKPNSFTGEDVLELQTHGSPILLNLLINIITSINGVRFAKKGEFTKRAFMNKKIDLLQAEAIDDLIQSKSEFSLRCAIKSLQGEFSKFINKIIKKIIFFRSEIEARIDFLQDDEKYFDILKIKKKINNLIISLKNIIKCADNSKLIRNGIKIVFSGPPNVGKSSLFNVLLKNKKSIVTNNKGTTRDILHEYIYIDNFLFELIDTAGIRLTKNLIENIGIKLTLKEIKNADFVFFIIDITTNYFKQYNIIKKFLPKLFIKKNFIIIFNKCDLLPNNIINLYKLKYPNSIFISTLNNFGINLIFKFLIKKIFFFVENNNIFLIRNRHILNIKSSIKILKKTKRKWIFIKNIELLAEDLYLVQKSLNKIDGSIISEKILSNIFSNFCIGK